MKKILLTFALVTFCWLAGSAQINSFPHYQTFESFSTCGTDCGDACTLSSGWVNSSSDDIDWTVDRSGTPTSGTGPDYDHTPGSGRKYLYTESSGSCNNSTAMLLSPMVDLTGQPCMEMKFWHSMRGWNSHMGRLHVDVKDGSGTWHNDVIPSIREVTNSTSWRSKTVDLSAYAGQTIQIRFRGRTGNGYRSDMAIDDVSFRSIYQEPTCPSYATVNMDHGQCDYTIPDTRYDLASLPCGTTSHWNNQNSGTSLAGVVLGQGDNWIKWSATNGSETEDCWFRIRVRDDDQDPVMSCPDITVSADPGVCEADIDISVGASDNCSQGITVFRGCSDVVDYNPNTDNGPGNVTSLSLSGVPTSASSYVELRVYHRGDINNNGERFDIIGEDGTDLGDTDYGDRCRSSYERTTVNIPLAKYNAWAADGVLDIDLDPKNNQIDPDGCSFGRNDAYFCITVDGGGIELWNDYTGTRSQPSGVYPVGTTKVWVNAEDEEGNDKWCSFDVTVEDNEDPVATCPGNMRVNTDPGVCEAVVNYNVSSSDNCPGETLALTQGLASGATFPKGKTDITWKATDASGNMHTCSFFVRVRDREGPDFDNCPSSVTLTVPFGTTGAVHTWPTITATDNCTKVNKINISCFPLSGSTFPLGTTKVTCVAEDKAGNTTTCCFDVTVNTQCNPLPNGLSIVDVGNTQNVQGNVCYTPPSGGNSGEYDVVASGNQIGTNMDGFTFIYLQMNMNVDVRARISMPTPGSFWTQAGVMVRQSLAANSAHASTLLAADKSSRRAIRTTTGAFTVNTAGPALPGFPYWARIQKVGPIFYSYVSSDGITWVPIGTPQVVPIMGPFCVGIATAGYPTTTPTPFDIDNFTINGVSYREAAAQGLVSQIAVDAFPNPVTSHLTVKGMIGNVTEATITLRNAVGQELIVQRFDVEEGGMIEHRIEMGDLAAGVYLVEVRAGEERKTLKVVKK